MEFDDVLQNHLGGFGTWQKLTILAVGFTYFPSVSFAPTFTQFVPKFRCKINYCESGNETKFQDSFVKFAVPGFTSFEEFQSSCQHYQFLNLTNTVACESCSANNFNRSKVCTFETTYVFEIISKNYRPGIYRSVRNA